MRTETATVRADDASRSGDRREVPAAPRSIQETGLTFQFLLELTTKMLFEGGQLRLADLARQSKLVPGILEQVLAFMRSERLCEVTQRTAAQADISYVLTELGRDRALDFKRHSQYAGPAPVSLSAYVERVEHQSILEQPVTRSQMRAAFAGCVINEALLDRLGVAMHSGRPLFLYGPAGSGKTFTAARLVNVFDGPVYVPFAIAVGSEVIEVFDPLVHKPVVDPELPVRRVLDRAVNHDERWVLCHRPTVFCGGDLAASMLNLEFDEGRKVHALPAQAKANNGVLILDDLGRQLVHVRDLLNRWILPLDSAVDYMTLRSGKRFKIPVDVKVIFCTNLSPSEIGDEAFLRRLGHKVYVGALDQSNYSAIVRQVCEELGISYSTDGLEHLLRKHRAGTGRPLLASNPREILGLVGGYAHYHGVPAAMTPAMLDWAWNNRFVADHPPTELRTMRTIREGMTP